MKNYRISVSCLVYEDNYINGESIECVNNFTISDIVKAESPKEAILKHYENSMFFSIDIKKAHIDEDGVHYDTLVDVDNQEVSIGSLLYKEWKEGKVKLYNCSQLIAVDELVTVDYLQIEQ